MPRGCRGPAKPNFISLSPLLSRLVVSSVDIWQLPLDGELSSIMAREELVSSAVSCAVVLVPLFVHMFAAGTDNY